MADGSRFWYAEGAPANTVIWKVDPVANTKTPLFDTARLRQALTPLLGHEPPYQGLPFDKFSFVDKAEKTVKFTVEGKEFILRGDTYTISHVPALPEEEKKRLVLLKRQMLYRLSYGLANRNILTSHRSFDQLRPRAELGDFEVLARTAFRRPQTKTASPAGGTPSERRDAFSTR